MNREDYEKKFREIAYSKDLEWLIQNIPFEFKKKVVMCFDFKKLRSGIASRKHKISVSYICDTCKKFLNQLVD